MKWQAKHTSLLTIAVGFGCLYFIFRKEWLWVPISISLVAFLIGPLGQLIHLGWMMLAKLLGYINNRLLLLFLFFAFLTPIALLMRLFGKNNFSLLQTNKKSFFITRNHFFVKEDFDNPF